MPLVPAYSTSIDACDPASATAKSPRLVIKLRDAHAFARSFAHAFARGWLHSSYLHAYPPTHSARKIQPPFRARTAPPVPFPVGATTRCTCDTAEPFQAAKT